MPGCAQHFARIRGVISIMIVDFPSLLGIALMVHSDNLFVTFDFQPG